MGKIRDWAPIIVLVVAIMLISVFGLYAKAAEHAFYEWLGGILF